MAADATDPREAWRHLRDKAHSVYRDQPEKALSTWEQALPLVPVGADEWLESQIFRTRLFIGLKRWIEAIATCEECLKVESIGLENEAIVLADLASALYAAGRHDEAVARAAESAALIDQDIKDGANADYWQCIREDIARVFKGARK